MAKKNSTSTQNQTEKLVVPVDHQHDNLFWLIARVVVSLGLGMGIAFIIQNILGKEQIVFSTLDLINLFLSFVLSGGSIVLAITAINLGKFSEKAITDRSDKSIELQTTIHNQTIETLRRIASSTGITEKRLEDFMKMDRSVDKAVQDTFPNPKTLSELDRNKISELLKQNMSQTIPESSQGDADEYIYARDRMRPVSTRAKYRAFKDSVLESIASEKDIEVIKKGEGNLGAKGHDLVDGVFKLNGATISVSTFFGSDTFDSNQYVFEIAKELQKNIFSKSFFVFDTLSEEQQSRIKSAIAETGKLIAADMPKKIIVLTGSAESVSKEIIKQN